MIGTVEIVNNTESKRYEATINGQTAYIAYMSVGQNMVLSHTEVPIELEGKGLAGQLAKHAMETVRQNGQKVIVACPFMIGYIRRHPEYLDLVFG